MPVRHARFAVPTGATNTALELRSVASWDRDAGDSILVKNTGTVTVGLGNDAMDDTTSFPLGVGETAGFDLDKGDVLYARVQGGTAGALAVIAVR